MSGRANDNFEGTKFDAVSLYKIYISHYYLSTNFEDDIFIQLDLLHRDNIIGKDDFILNGKYFGYEGFSSIFKELIIDEQGDVFPIAHGCSKFLRIGNIHSGETLHDMIERFIVEKIPFIVDLYQRTYQEILESEGTEIVNWSENIIRKSHEMFDLSFGKCTSKNVLFQKR